MTESVLSKSGVPIRLTDERWLHITEEHTELAGYRLEILEAIAAPERILAGADGEHLAVPHASGWKVLVAVYRELEEDGFVITAFATRRLASLHRRTQIWPSPRSSNS
jgi:hypothetical protein